MDTKELTCIVCPMGCPITVTMEEGEIRSVEGNTCPRGEAYAKEEVVNPTRTVTTSVKVKDGRMLSVKTAQPIPKGKIMPCMEELKKICLTAPVHIGDTVVDNIADTGVAVVATRNL